MKWYHLNESGEVIGPVLEQDLKELRSEGALNGETQVCQEGSEEWVTLAGAIGKATNNSGREEIVHPLAEGKSVEPSSCSIPPEILEKSPVETDFGFVVEPQTALENTASTSATDRIKAGASAGWAGVKRNSKIAALHAQIEKLRKVDLKKAYRALGERCYELRLLEDQLGQSFDAIRELEVKIAADRELEQAPDGEKMTDALKRMTSQAARATHAKALNLKLPPLLTELGRLAYSRNDEGNLPGVETEVEDICVVETQIQQIESKVENIRDNTTEAGKGEAIVDTPPPLLGQSVNSPDTKQDLRLSRQTALPTSSKAGSNPRLKFIVIGCGATAILSVIVVVGVISMMIGGGNAGGSANSTGSPGDLSPTGFSEPKMMTCMRCKGSGDQQVSCKHCYGTRVLTTRQGQQMVCPHCQGLGVAKITCGGCRGRGIVKYSRENLYAPSHKSYNPDLPLDFQ